MDMAQPRSFRPSLSLRQMMKLVVFGAIASACLAPGYHLVENGVSTWPGCLVLEGVAVPLALALAAFPLVRKGPLKDWLIRAALLVSVSFAVGFAIYLSIFILTGWASRRMPPEIGFLVADGLIITGLSFACVLLAKDLIPRKCPDCSRWSMILDAKATVPPGGVRGRCYRCLCCQGRLHQPRHRETVRSWKHESE
jgi:hypothetical protein